MPEVAVQTRAFKRARPMAVGLRRLRAAKGGGYVIRKRAYFGRRKEPSDAQKEALRLGREKMYKAWCKQHKAAKRARAAAASAPAPAPAPAAAPAASDSGRRSARARKAPSRFQ